MVRFETEVKDPRKSRYSYVAAVLCKLALDGTILSSFEETCFKSSRSLKILLYLNPDRPGMNLT
jgi:hypothetical protein